MTLQPYDHDRLDGLSLRVLDLCTRLRTLARIGRDEQLPHVELHDRKALEWLDKLEDWLLRAEGEVNRQVQIHRGTRRARESQAKHGK